MICKTGTKMKSRKSSYAIVAALCCLLNVAHVFGATWDPQFHTPSLILKMEDLDKPLSSYGGRTAEENHKLFVAEIKPKVEKLRSLADAQKTHLDALSSQYREVEAQAQTYKKQASDLLTKETQNATAISQATQAYQQQIQALQTEIATLKSSQSSNTTPSTPTTPSAPSSAGSTYYPSPRRR